MAEFSSSFSSLTLLLIIFLHFILCPSISSLESNVRILDRELLEIRTNPKLNKTNKKPKCCEMRTRSQCSAFPRCKWCRSEALDDLCFSKAEALRLPSQVFLWLSLLCFNGIYIVVCDCPTRRCWLWRLGAGKAILSKDLV